MFAVTVYVVAGQLVPLYVTVATVTDVHPVIVLAGAVYLHALLVVEPFASVVYVPPVGDAPVRVLHAVHASADAVDLK